MFFSLFVEAVFSKNVKRCSTVLSLPSSHINPVFTTRPVEQLPGEFLRHDSCKDWTLGSDPASNWHSATVSRILDERPSLWCCAEEQWRCRTSRPCSLAICSQQVFQESAGWILFGSRPGATRTASGNCCFESSGVCLAWLYLWWAALSKLGSWSWTPATGGGLWLAKVSKCDWGRLQCFLEQHFCPANLARSTWPPCSEGCLWREGCRGFWDLQPAPRLWKAEFWSAGPNLEKRRFGRVSGGSGVKVSKDRNASLAMLLQLVDFQSISVENLLRLGRFALSGPTDDDLHREVNEALRVRSRKRIQSPQSFRPKRLCLQHWSPDFGASAELWGREVLPTASYSLHWHKGAIYSSDFFGGVFCWKPGDPATQVRQLLGEGARVSGINDLGRQFDISISPTGEIFAADYDNERLLSFYNGSGSLVLDELQDGDNMCCSPNGVLYVLTAEALQKVEGSRLQTVMTLESLPEDLQFAANAMIATKEEVIYILDNENSRILRLNPADSFEPVVIGEVPEEHEPDLSNFFITEGGTIYVTDFHQRKVLAIRPGDEDFTDVLKCPGTLRPTAVLVQDRSLYVSMSPRRDSQRTGGLYEYELPPELQLEWKTNAVMSGRWWPSNWCLNSSEWSGSTDQNFRNECLAMCNESKQDKARLGLLHSIHWFRCLFSGANQTSALHLEWTLVEAIRPSNSTLYFIVGTSLLWSFTRDPILDIMLADCWSNFFPFRTSWWFRLIHNFWDGWLNHWALGLIGGQK